MHMFSGQLLSHEGGHVVDVTVQVEDNWVRIYNTHKRFGAWAAEDLKVQRITVFRFQMELDGVLHNFSPDDPNGFSDAVGAVIDLRRTTRFGLGDRVRAALAEQAAVKEAEAATASS